MKIEKVMEASQKYMDAYEYVKRLLRTNDEMKESRDSVIARVGRMFGLKNIKDFHTYTLKRIEKEEHYGF